ncbi:MAG: zinc-dependent alcohol dehydrogenase [Opitutales bacterium]
MNKTMKQLVVTGPGEAELREVPIPEPGPREVLMKVTAVTTCPQWDLHLAHNEPMFVGHSFHYPYTPGQPGHEATGRVEAVGNEVTEYFPGDRVCAWQDPGHQGPGCYAQYVLHKAKRLIKIPEDQSDAAWAPLELAMCVGTVFRMLRDMDVLRDRSVAVSGLGPAGLIALQMALAEGARSVVGFDLKADRFALAKSLGAAGCYDPRGVSGEDFPARPDQPGIETAIDCVGAKASVEFLMDRSSDVVALFGVQRETYAFEPRHFSLRLCGYGGHSRESADYAAALVQSGKLKLEPLVTHQLPLERYVEAVHLLDRQQAIKVCFLPWASA